MFLFFIGDFYSTRIIRFEIIAKRGIIARMSYNTSFGLYEKLRKGRFFFFTFFNFLAATQKVSYYRFLHILTESDPNYFHQNIGVHMSDDPRN